MTGDPQAVRASFRACAGCFFRGVQEHRALRGRLYNALMAAGRRLKDARITVMGLGRFGGGVGVTRWLVEQGARVLVTDLDPPERLAEPLAAIDDLVRGGRVTLRLGGHDFADFAGADLIIANPAIPKPWKNPYLLRATSASVPITTEIRLVIERLPRRERVIGVTGTAGKSTTSAMIAAALGGAGLRVRLGGNIGGSLLPMLPTIGATDYVVLELSSAMLHWLSPAVGYSEAPGWSPGLAVITNCAPNHLDWHGEYAHYEASKQQILRSQQPGDLAVMHARLAAWSRSAGPSDRRIEWMNFDDARAAPTLAIPGRHNRLNAAFALRAVGLLGADMQRAAEALASFPGLAHRLELVGKFEIGGPGEPPVRAFNDSKSTTPEAAALAVAAMDDDQTIGAARVRLICGGYDKQIDLAPMVAPAARCARAYTLGATGPALAEAIRGAGGRATNCATLACAVERAVQDLRPGDVLLLSPGCASWDQFTNFEIRGRQFAETVRNLLSDKALSTPKFGTE